MMKFDNMEICILFVGEGDFSFSANYILKYKNNLHEKIYATCLNFDALTDKQKANIKIIETNGGIVHTDVDAVSLEYHPVIKNIKFSRIYFNFPHITGKMNIRDNRKLLQEFFISSQKILQDHGRVWVTLCQGQGGTPVEKVKRLWCDTWQVVSLASCASLILNDIQPFNATEYKLYKCTGYRGLQKSFNTEGALTHIFCCRGSVQYIPLQDREIQKFKRVELFIKYCETLYRSVCEKQDSPHQKILHILKTITSYILESLHQIILKDVLFCSRIYLFEKLDDPSGEEDICKQCFNNLFAQYLNKKKDSVNSIFCSICCIKNFNPRNQRFFHSISYFFDNTKQLLSSLTSILDYLNKAYSSDVDEKLAYVNKYEISLIGKKISSLTVLENNQNLIFLNDIYSSFNIILEKEFYFYSNINFFIPSESSKIDKINHFKIGSIIKYIHNSKSYYCIFLNLDNLACLKYHIMDHRVLFLDKSYYIFKEFHGSTQQIYRSPSLYPPSYIHDTSFYIDNDFCENLLYLIIRNAAGDLINSVTLIDSYYNKNNQKYSRCYRFLYQSCYKALSKEKANIIHSKIIRKCLEKLLNITLR